MLAYLHEPECARPSGRAGQRSAVARWGCKGPVVLLLLLAMVLALPGPPLGAEEAPEAPEAPEVATTAVEPQQIDEAIEAPLPGPIPADGPKFTVTEFIFEYGRQPVHPKLPDLAFLQEIEVALGRTDAGYVAPREGVPAVMLRIGDVPTDSLQQFHASAIRQVNDEVRLHFNNVLHLFGVYVEPHRDDVEEKRTRVREKVGDKITETLRIDLEDLRGERTTLRQLIWVGVVGRMRTVASGKRLGTQDRINSEVHRWVLDRSPVKPAGRYAAMLISRELFLSESIRQVGRRWDKNGKEYAAVVGKLEDNGATADQGYTYSAATWSLAEARAHADEVGAVFQDRTIGRDDLLRKDLLDEFVLRASRHPGRRVDVAVAAAGRKRGEVALDFLVTENKPWLAYFQVSNTGTASTDRLSERMGVVHQQLTGHDDVLSLDYSTANFDASHVVTGSYEAPVWGVDGLRWAVRGSWNEFTASDLGVGNVDFTGDGWSVAGDLIYNIFQYRELFVDALAGVEWRHVSVKNEGAGSEADVLFFVPHAGLKLERVKDAESTFALVNVELQRGGGGGSADEDELQILGRADPDKYWTVLEWDMSHAFYLEPLLNPDGWRDPKSGWATLAHELGIALRGQYAFNHRLVPHAEAVVGGLYSVRGYPESVASGDSTWVGNVEYRLHIPNAINPYKWASKKGDRRVGGSGKLFGQRFQYLPPHPYGTADWDLILRAFFDIGQAFRSKIDSSTETQERLASVGMGLELKVKQNISLRLDWAVSLRPAEAERVSRPGGSPQRVYHYKSGEHRCHIVATFLY